MNRTIYALLVGIDRYPAGIPSLYGCVNDITHLHDFLAARFSGNGDRFAPLVITDQQATRQGVIDGFRQHLARAAANDVALFCYSGHGSQARTPPELLALEPDGLNETLVCYDSRQPGNWDLADKELAQLIAEVAANGPHIAVLLDCCHSGTGTRAPAEEVAGVRRVPTDQRERPVESFLVTSEQAAAFALPAARGAAYASGWFKVPAGRHVVLSACRADETAKELSFNGERRGVFSYHLLETLQQGAVELSYRDLFKRVNARVRAGVAQQSPCAEASDPADLDMPFLGGNPGRPSYTVSYDPGQGWVMDGGTVHGIPAPVGNETTHLALFPFDTDLSVLSSLDTAVGAARVTQVFPTRSAVELTMRDGNAPDRATTYKALITALPLPPMIVTFAGDTAALETLRRALAQADPGGGPSLLVREGELSAAAYLVRAEDENYRIQRTGDSYPLAVDTPGFSADSAMLTVQRLEHIACWHRLLELANPASQLASDAVRLEILLPTEDGEWQPVRQGSSLRLSYSRQDGDWQAPAFKARLVNTSRRRLYCMLFDLPATYGVFPVLPGSGVWLEPGATCWVKDGQPIKAQILDHLWEQGITSFDDILKLIVTTDESDATLLRQPDLPVEVIRARELRSIGHMNTLNRLMQRVNTRHFDTEPQDREAFADWIAAEVSFTTIRPQEATAVAEPGRAADLGHHVYVAGHPRLQARMRLSGLPEVGRDAGNRVLPALLRDHPEAAEPFTFSASRAGEPGLSVIELLDVADHSVVTPDEPLLVRIDQPLAADEVLLALGYDGEFFLPLGRVMRDETGVDVRLERLPAPTRAGERDLKGSIKILFQKLVGQRMGWPYAHPLLAVATVAADGKVSYSSDSAAVHAAVAPARRILLYIHGIIGDTRGLAASARTAWLQLPEPVPAVAERYDLILTYDYESLHTTIEENARLLKQRLREIGLGPGHGKTLDIVAHSMGGLLARWLIEHEEGNQMVSRLVLLGVPNAGSPWPTVEDYAIVALGFGLNVLAKIAWPIRIVGLLVGALEKVDVALDQLRPGSDLLKTLAGSADPGLPYVVLAGNTALLPQGPPGDGSQPGLVERLLARLAPEQLRRDLSRLVFFGQPNDTAVSVASMASIPRYWAQAGELHAIASDHLMYFNSSAGLAALVGALEAPSIVQGA